MICAAGVCLSVAFDGPLLSLMSATANAAPVVNIRARTKIVMEPVRRGTNGIEVSGRVVDVFTDEPVPFKTVSVQMNNVARTARTDVDGLFSASFRLPDGRYNINVQYDGDRSYDQSDLLLGNVDISKQSLQLTVKASEVEHSKNNVEVSIVSRTDLGGFSVPLELYAGNHGEQLQHISRLKTDRDGRLTYALARQRLGTPGRKRVSVRFLGSPGFNPVEAVSNFVLTTKTATTFDTSRNSIAYEDTLSGAGRVVNAQGVGIAGETVLLISGSKRVGHAITDDEGNFEITTSGTLLGSGTVFVQAVLDPSKTWIFKSRSAPVEIAVGKPEPVPITYTLAAFGATALAMIAFLGLRSKPWEGWIAKLKKRAPKENEQLEGDDEVNDASHGLQLARPSFVSSLRRPNEFDFAGQVRDSYRARRLAGADVVLFHTGGDGHTFTTSTDGTFAFDALTAGEWSVRVSSFGFVSESFTIQIPHRGELRGARIDLLPVRERIFALYGEIARGLLPNPNLWGVWTPRQIFDHVRSFQPADALSRLTDFVEDSYFSQRTPTEAVLDQASALLMDARRERAAKSL